MAENSRGHVTLVAMGDRRYARPLIVRLVALAGIYLAVGFAAIVVINGDAQNGDAFVWVLAVVALALGFEMRPTRHRWTCFVVPFLLLLMALPFGEANKVTGADDVHLVSTYLILPVTLSLLAIALGAALRGRLPAR